MEQGGTLQIQANLHRHYGDWSKRPQKLNSLFPDIQLLKSGPLGGDQQLGAMIAEGNVGILIFLWDPMEPQPHDVDIKALLRLAVLYNVPTACNRATADYLISSSLLGSDYEPDLPDYSGYLNRLSSPQK